MATLNECTCWNVPARQPDSQFLDTSTCLPPFTRWSTRAYKSGHKNNNNNENNVSMAFLCPVRIRRGKKKKCELDPTSNFAGLRTVGKLRKWYVLSCQWPLTSQFDKSCVFSGQWRCGQGAVPPQLRAQPRDGEDHRLREHRDPGSGGDWEGARIEPRLEDGRAARFCTLCGWRTGGKRDNNIMKILQFAHQFLESFCRK